VNISVRLAFTLGVGAVAVALGVLVAPRAVVAQEPERPGYRKLRYEEDWSFLRDPGRRTDRLDVPKYIPLTDDGWAWLSLGGEVRERYEYTRNPAWGSDPQDKDGVFLQRYGLHGDLHLGPNVRIFAQLLSALEDGRAGPSNPVDENELDVQQAFLDLSSDLGPEARATVRFGRQEMSFGSARLVDVREGPNVRRKFDGGRLLVDVGQDWHLDGVVVRPAEIKPGLFDDGINENQALWGVYGVATPARLLTGIDLYYLGYHNADGSYDQGTANETRHTVGVRVWGDRAGWDWNWEFIYQWGRFDAGDIRAWSVASNTGYTWPAAPWEPRLGLSANVASGDRNPKDRNLETFNPLFPRGNYFSELALLGPRNFYNLHPSLSVSPHKGLVLSVDVDFFWRLESADGIYSPSGQLASGKMQSFAKGTWGGEWHPEFAPREGDIIIKEHWGQSGFANTDLDFWLKQRGIAKVIVVGLLANTCIESTSRFAMELGYHVTLVRDATAAFSKERMHAAHELNGPNFAHEILTTAGLVAALAHT
jgi:hypothetical protein